MSSFALLQSLIVTAVVTQWAIELYKYLCFHSDDLKNYFALRVERALHGGPSTEQALMLNRYRIPARHNRIIAVRPT